MTKKERKAYNQGKSDGYAEGYSKGLHDGNPFIAIGELMADMANRAHDMFEENPELIKEYIENQSKSEKQEEDNEQRAY